MLTPVGRYLFISSGLILRIVSAVRTSFMTFTHMVWASDKVVGSVSLGVGGGMLGFGVLWQGLRAVHTGPILLSA